MSLSANGFERFQKHPRLNRARLITRSDDGYIERITLARLRELMQKPQFKGNAEAQSFLREAETLIDPK